MVYLSPKNPWPSTWRSTVVPRNGIACSWIWTAHLWNGRCAWQAAGDDFVWPTFEPIFEVWPSTQMGNKTRMKHFFFFKHFGHFCFRTTKPLMLEVTSGGFCLCWMWVVSSHQAFWWAGGARLLGESFVAMSQKVWGSLQSLGRVEQPSSSSSSSSSTYP